jgi:hypothetical protein
MRFVDHDQIPRCGLNVGCFVPRKLVGADDDTVRADERAEITRIDLGVVRLGLNERARNEKPLVQILMSLLAKVGRRNDENTPFRLCPSLGNDQSGFNGFAKADLVGQQRPF